VTIYRIAILSAAFIVGVGLTIPAYAASEKAEVLKGTCSSDNLTSHALDYGTVSTSDGVQTGAASGRMNTKDYLALMKRVRDSHMTLGADGFLWSTQPLPCDQIGIGQIDDKGRRAVIFLNGPHNPIFGFAGSLVGGDGPILLADAIYLTDGKEMPLNQGANAPQCHFYFTDHGTFTKGWENRLTTVECNAKIKGADAQLISVKVKFDATQTAGSAIADKASLPNAGAKGAPPETPSYDPVPEAWNIKIGLPGTLSVGAEYCTQSGNCQYVGEGNIGLIQVCQETPDAEACLKARVPVQVLASSPNGSVIVRLNGRNYGVGGMQWEHREPDGSSIGGPVSVIYQGVTIPLRLGWQPSR
jgi:hypothetical protein